MPKPRTMKDCVDLMERELGLNQVSKAMGFINHRYNNAWKKHIDEVGALVGDEQFMTNQAYREAVASQHYATLLGFVKKYKTEAPEFADQTGDLFQKGSGNV